MGRYFKEQEQEEMIILSDILDKVISKKIIVKKMEILIETQQACEAIGDNKGKVVCEGETTKTLTLEYKEIY